MKIVKVHFEDIKPFANKASKEHVSFADPSNSHWFAIKENDKIISFYCLVLSKKSARFKSNYTIPEFRGRGCLQAFIEQAKEICKFYGIHEMTAFCTSMSLNSHLRNGAVIQSQKKDGIAFVKYFL